jgi:hypothetical protein
MPSAGLFHRCTRGAGENYPSSTKLRAGIVRAWFDRRRSRRKEEALREGRRAVELCPIEKDAVLGVAMIKYLAMIAAWVGDKDLACEQLAIATRKPGDLSYGQLKLMPFWDPLRGDPRFEKIVASLAPKQN